jgi:hypothetical protein
MEGIEWGVRQMWDIWGFASRITGIDAVRSDEIDIVGTKDSSDDGSVRPTLKLSPRRQRGTKGSAVYPEKRGKMP